MEKLKRAHDQVIKDWGQCPINKKASRLSRGYLIWCPGAFLPYSTCQGVTANALHSEPRQGNRRIRFRFRHNTYPGWLLTMAGYT